VACQFAKFYLVAVSMSVDLCMAKYSTLAEPVLFSSVEKICDLLVECGGRPYFVGGCVRDALMNMRISDFDIEVFGLSFADLQSILARKFRFSVQNCKLRNGVSFGVIKISGLNVDVSVPRTEVKTGLKHTDFDVCHLSECSIAEAANRRDFTINSIYFDVSEGVLRDPFGGVVDLGDRILRSVSDKFSEDPLRVLRGMQFAARFAMVASTDVISLASELNHSELSPERIFCEWRKFMLLGVKPSAGLRFLNACSWTQFFPEIEAMINGGKISSEYFGNNAFEHTCLALDRYASDRSGISADDLIVGFAVLCHNFGEPEAAIHGVGGISKCCCNDIGAALARKFLENMRAPKYLVDGVALLVKHGAALRDILGQNSIRGAAVLRLANVVGRLDRLLRVYKYCGSGLKFDQVSGRGDANGVLRLETMASGLGVLKNRPTPLILGRDLLAMGLNPSPKFGSILNECFEAQLDMKFVDRDGGLRFLRGILQLT
jgi:tRNA nucleotidyltransferase (CCA-adding enzyme)